MAIHLHYLLTHSTAPSSRCKSEKQNRSKEDQEEEVRRGVSPRYSGDMQRVLFLAARCSYYIQLKRTAFPAEFRKELKAVFC